jgi:hypothetical protein
MNAKKTRLNSLKDLLKRNWTKLVFWLPLSVFWLLYQIEELSIPLWFACLWDHLIHKRATRELIAPWFWFLSEWVKDRLAPTLTQTLALRSGVEQLTLVIEVVPPGHAEGEGSETSGDRESQAIIRRRVTLSLTLSHWG